MELLILLAVLYIVLCFVLARNLSKRKLRSNKIYRVSVLISSIVAVLGGITPINFVYTFVLAYVIILVGWIAQGKVDIIGET